MQWLNELWSCIGTALQYFKCLSDAVFKGSSARTTAERKFWHWVIDTENKKG